MRSIYAVKLVNGRGSGNDEANYHASLVSIKVRAVFFFFTFYLDIKKTFCTFANDKIKTVFSMQYTFLNTNNLAAQAVLYFAYDYILSVSPLFLSSGLFLCLVVSGNK